MLEPIPNSPIVNAGVKYVNNLEIAKTGNKTMTMNAGAARDSTNTNDILLSSQVTINGAALGANGVDIAVLVASTMYYVYVIGDSTGYKSTAGLLSLSATPSLPFDYDMYRRVGWVLTDGSSNILQFWQFGQGQTRAYYYDVGLSLTTSSVTTFTPLSLVASVPPLATQVIFDITYTPASATNIAQFLPFGSSATNGIVRFGTGVAAAQVGQIVVPCRLNSGVPTIQYEVSNAGDTLALLTVGFFDYMII